jgi:hypothetical protein
VARGAHLDLPPEGLDHSQKVGVLQAVHAPVGHLARVLHVHERLVQRGPLPPQRLELLLLVRVQDLW